MQEKFNYTSMTADIRRRRGRPRHDGFPVGEPPPELPPAAKEIALQAMEDFRVSTSAFRDQAERPKQSMSRIYRESRRIARICGPEMMWSLVNMALTCEDPRVRSVCAIAVLDRGGIMPAPYDADEDTKDLHLLPLAERRERLRTLMVRAAELLQEPRGAPVEGED